MEGVAEKKAHPRPLQAMTRRRTDADENRRREQASCRTRSTPQNALGPRPQGRAWRWTRCAARRATPTSTTLSGGETPPRRAVPAAARSSPTCCCSTSRPTTSTPSRWPGSSATCRSYPGTRRRRHPRPLLPRQRRRLDPRARPRRAASPARATTPSWLEQKAEAPRSRRRSEDAAPPADARARAGVDRGMAPQGAPGQEQGAPQRATRSCSPRRSARSATSRRRSSSRRAAARRHRRRGRGPAQGLRRQPADRRPRLQAAAAAASSASSARTAPARPRCSA
ncbi:MAG: hypothetical protein MZV49_10190 [Rhodopseudomonas palustris]|nr:hypothetical protein [Rhodopseudomonas palustris]